MSRRGGEAATVAGSFLAYGAMFFDRLAPLFLVGLIADDFGVPSAAEGTLALLIGLGWAAAMPLVRATAGRLGDRDRILVAAVVSALFSAGSAAAGSWVAFVLLRGLGGLASASGAPAITALTFRLAPARRRGLDLGIVQSSTRIVGSIASPIAVTSIAVAAGWRPAIATSAALLVVGAVALALAVPGDRAAARRAPSTEFELHPHGRRNIVLSTVGSVALVAWLTVWSQSSVPLVRDWLGVGTDAAGRLVGAFGVGAGVASFLVPTTSDRIGRRAALAAAVGAGGAGGVALAVLAGTGTVPSRGVVVAVIVLAGVAMGGLPMVISVIPAETVTRGDVGRALLVPIAGAELLGGALLPAVAAAAAVPLGLPAVVGATAAFVVSLALVSRALRPTGDAPAEDRRGVRPAEGPSLPSDGGGGA